MKCKNIKCRLNNNNHCITKELNCSENKINDNKQLLSDFLKVKMLLNLLTNELENLKKNVTND